MGCARARARRGEGGAPALGRARGADPGPRRQRRRGAGRGPAAMQAQRGRRPRRRRGRAAARTANCRLLGHSGWDGTTQGAAAGKAQLAPPASALTRARRGPIKPPSPPRIICFFCLPHGPLGPSRQKKQTAGALLAGRGGKGGGSRCTATPRGGMGARPPQRDLGGWDLLPLVWTIKKPAEDLRRVLPWIRAGIRADPRRHIQYSTSFGSMNQST